MLSVGQRPESKHPLLGGVLRSSEVGLLTAGAE